MRIIVKNIFNKYGIEGAGISIILFFTLLLLNGTTYIFAQTQEDLFSKANKAYEKSDFKSAIEIYNQILNNGYESGPLLFNLGNAYFKTGQFANAILFYERAKRYLPTDSDLKHNITIANLRIPDRLETVPRIFLFEWWESLKNLFSPSFYQFFIFFLFCIFIAFVTLFFWSRDYSFRKNIFFIGLAFTIIFILFTSAFISKSVEIETKRSAIIFSHSVDVKSSPDEASTTLYIIHYGLKIDILDELDTYYRIVLPDGKTGWILNNSVVII